MVYFWEHFSWNPSKIRDFWRSEPNGPQSPTGWSPGPPSLGFFAVRGSYKNCEKFEKNRGRSIWGHFTPWAPPEGLTRGPQRFSRGGVTPNRPTPILLKIFTDPIWTLNCKKPKEGGPGDQLVKLWGAFGSTLQKSRIFDGFQKKCSWKKTIDNF